MIYKLNDGQRHQDQTQSVAVDLALKCDHRSYHIIMYLIIDN